MPEFHLIECHRFAAARRVKERSLSSILRSKLLNTLINNDVSGIVNARGLRESFGQIDAMREGVEEKKTELEETMGGVLQLVGTLGTQEAAGSNPVTPTNLNQGRNVHRNFTATRSLWGTMPT